MKLFYNENKMSYLLFAILSSLAFGLAPFKALAIVTCKCEVLECGPCENEIDIKFYSDKCGDNLTRMKSCKKSVCEAVSNQDKCFAEHGIEKDKLKVVGEQASVRQPANIVQPIGFVETVIGKAELHRLNQKAQLCTKEQEVFEDDRIITEHDSKIKVVFTKTKDELHINADSNVIIQKFMHPNEPDDHPEVKKTIIKLDLGKIRVRISKGRVKYDHDKNTFQVKTKTAVAGVRGTDFVMSYDEFSKASDLQTLAGAVEMNAQNSGELSGLAILVSAGEACRTNVTAEFSEITALRKMDAKALRILDQTTEVKEVEAENLALKAHSLEASNSICRSPEADFKECAWFCEGNPKKESRCRTDLKDVSCVRKMCGANGQWILPTRMPSSQGGQCSGKSPVKGPCGIFW